MKKFIIAACGLLLALFLGNWAYYRMGIYIDWHPNAPAASSVRTQGKEILIEREGRFEPFEIRGVDMGVGAPGRWATGYAIDEETYLRWFGQIQELGANTIRVYTLLHEEFYNAFYEYNKGREEPLYLLHGIWVNDYIHNSHRDAYDEEFLKPLERDCRDVVDVIHGKKNLSLGEGTGSGSYRKDISCWVLGYIIGVEWESGLVVYTNQKSEGRNTYAGEYLYTSGDATAFEAMLCQVGDGMIGYESRRYKQQRLVAFSNWPATDPFAYPVAVAAYRGKAACVDGEHIKGTDAFGAGMFASYHVYPYFPDYLELMKEAEGYSEQEIQGRMGEAVWKNLTYRVSLLEAPEIGDYLREEDYRDSQGRFNTYLAYLRALNRYHTLPVVIAEYGVTTGRGMAQRDVNTGRNQGHMTEQEQGRALAECYRDIMEAGCAGSCVFTWQDEWFKRTWNTMHAVDLGKTPYWSDYQTNEQYFGLLSFDPGREKSVCYVDGDISEWAEGDMVVSGKEMALSMKYDEKFLYFLIWKEGLDQEEDTLYIPIDITEKSGSRYCREYGVSFGRPCDFLLVVHGKQDSRLVVQQRYEALLASYGEEFYGRDPYLHPPPADSPSFVPVYLPLVLKGLLGRPGDLGIKYETGKLRYGNANPQAEEFDSLADFIFAGDHVEVRLPWQLLNFSNPSEMMVHDDYYENYGIENLSIDRLYVGAGYQGEERREIPMEAFPLKGWGKRVSAHERLKSSYYILQEYWKEWDRGHS